MDEPERRGRVVDEWSLAAVQSAWLRPVRRGDVVIWRGHAYGVLEVDPHQDAVWLEAV